MITATEINEFVAAVNTMLAAHNEKSGFRWQSFVEADVGKKRVRIVKREKHGENVVGGSAFCFVDLETGNIFKAASWAAPAKHARGNIKNGSNDLTAYGAIYLR